MRQKWFDQVQVYYLNLKIDLSEARTVSHMGKRIDEEAYREKCRLQEWNQRYPADLFVRSTSKIKAVVYVLECLDGRELLKKKQSWVQTPAWPRLKERASSILGATISPFSKGSKYQTNREYCKRWTWLPLKYVQACSFFQPCFDNRGRWNTQNIIHFPGKWYQLDFEFAL